MLIWTTVITTVIIITILIAADAQLGISQDDNSRNMNLKDWRDSCPSKCLSGQHEDEEEEEEVLRRV